MFVKKNNPLFIMVIVIVCIVSLIMITDLTSAVPSGGVLFYEFTDNTTDIWNSNNGTGTNTTYSTNYPTFAVLGNGATKSLDFDGSISYFTQPNIMVGKTAISIAGYFNTTKTTTTYMLAWRDNVDARLIGIRNNKDGSGDIALQFYYDASNTVTHTDTSKTWNDGEYHNFVITARESDMNISFYLDGVLVLSTTAETFDLSNMNGMDSIWGYQHWSPDRYFSGQLDHIKIFDYALNITEVENYNNTGNINSSGEGGNNAPVVESCTILPVTTYTNDTLKGYTNISDSEGDNLTIFWKWFSDGVINSSGNTSNNLLESVSYNVNNVSSTITSIGENWTLSCMGNDGVVNGSWLNSSVRTIINYSITPPLGGLSYYKFEEGAGSILDDYWGDYNGTITDMTWNSTIPTFNISGTGDTSSGDFNFSSYVALTSLAIPTNASFSVNLWIKPDTTSQMYFFTEVTTSTDRDGCVIAQGTQNKIKIGCYISNGAGAWIQDVGPTFTTTGYQMITATYNESGQKLKYYYNGSFIAEDDGNRDEADNHITLGTVYHNVAGNYSGLMDELTIYNFTLNDSSVRSLFNYGNINNTLEDETLTNFTVNPVVRWVTNEEAVIDYNSSTAINYSVDYNALTKQNSSLVSGYNKIILTSLTTNTTYNTNISFCNITYCYNTSFNFTTNSDDYFKGIFFADPHNSVDDNYVSDEIVRVNIVRQSLIDNSYNNLICLGDATSQVTANVVTAIQEMQEVQAVMSNNTESNKYAWQLAFGNHDYGALNKTQSRSTFPYMNYYYDSCADINGCNSNDLNIGNIYVLNLDCYNTGGGGTCAFSSRELTRTELILNNTNLSNVIVTTHHAPVDAEFTNAGALRTILENSGKVLAVFGGHKHFDNQTTINGINYFRIESLAQDNTSWVYVYTDDTKLYIDYNNGYGNWSIDLFNVTVESPCNYTNYAVSLDGDTVSSCDNATIYFDSLVDADLLRVNYTSVYLENLSFSTSFYNSSGVFSSVEKSFLWDTPSTTINSSFFLASFKVNNSLAGVLDTNFTLDIFQAVGDTLKLFYSNIPDNSYSWDYLGTNSNETFNFSITNSGSSVINITFNTSVNSLLNITRVYDVLNNNTILNYTARVENSGGYNLTKTTTNGYLEFAVVLGDSYNVIIDNPLYELKTTDYTAITKNDNLTISLYTTNSIFMSVRDEETNILINETNINIEFTGTSNFYNYTTTNGSVYVDGVVPDSYSIKFSGGNYTTKYYVLDILNRSFNVLTAYLSLDYDTLVLTVEDQSNHATIENALVKIYSPINSSWALTSSKYTDVTGKLPVYYLVGESYKFVVSKSGYVTKTFTLDPVISSTYTVRLTRSSSSNPNPRDVRVSHTPKSFVEGNNSVNFSFTSPLDNLDFYSVNITYPGGSMYLNGTSSSGELMNFSFGISNASVFDTVDILYYYLTESGFNDSKTYHYLINEQGAGTLAKNKVETYGLGLFERIFLVILLSMIIAGIGYFIGGTPASITLSLLCYGVAIYIGFLPWQTASIPILLGMVMLLMKKGG